jgi:hypothetical protein
MIKASIYILTLLLLCDCSNQKGIKIKIVLPIDFQKTDSIKKQLNTLDSIQLLYCDTTGFKVFVDYNLKSIFHKLQKVSFSYPIYDSTFYHDSYSGQIKKRSSHKRIPIPNSIKSIWIPLYRLKSDFYIYRDCDFQTRFEINDSTFCSYGMMPIEPIIIDSLTFSDNTFEIISNNNEIVSLKLLDKNKSIYRIKKNEDCYYVTTLDMINEFPILVVICGGGISPIDGIVEIDKIDCK